MPPRHIVTYIPLLQRGKKYKCKAMCWVSSRSAQRRDPSHKPPQKPAKSSMMYPPIGAGRCTSNRQTSLQPHCHDAAPEKSRSWLKATNSWQSRPEVKGSRKDTLVKSLVQKRRVTVRICLLIKHTRIVPRKCPQPGLRRPNFGRYYSIALLPLVSCRLETGATHCS